MNAVVTLTPAAAIDHTYVMDSLTLDHVNRAASSHTELSGKGVNVAQAISLATVEVSAVLQLHASDRDLAGRSPVHPFISATTAERPTRINTTIIHDHGHTTKVNQSPVPLTAAEWQKLCQRTKDEISRLGAGWLVISGSIPTYTTGGAVDITELLEWAATQGVKTALDTSGPALEGALGASVPITLIKPNTHELAAHLGRSLRTVGDVIAAARELLTGALEIVYVSMGVDGALCITKSGVWLARATAATVANTAGAGDASLAGFVSGYMAAGMDSNNGGAAFEQAITRAASWGAHAVSLETTMLFSVATAPPANTQQNPDPAQALNDPAIL
ncbi:PfkB family carbohydrate kinase [Specibacter sp. NPDC078692]|uniref:1-phosphofructokinase family hexose kinase n=1 Tax=Specibacter sp. NPDC078692 TaxID=3155818 RepID=UPI00343498C7